MRRKMQVGCLALSALLLFAPGASLAVRAEMPNVAVFAENADAVVTPESVEELIAQIGDVTPKKSRCHRKGLECLFTTGRRLPGFGAEY